MASYEVEHNIKPQTKIPRARRPSMSSFFNQLSQITTASTPSNTHNNPHATPNPVEMAAAERLLHDQFATIHASTSPSDSSHRELLESLMSSVSSAIDNPPTTVTGVPQSFLDELERVPKTQLRKTDSCPICNEQFLDDPYPLVVQLPCHKTHRFDLDCVGPWLRMNGTCPLDRKEVERKTEVKKVPEVEKSAESDEEDYGMYA